MSDVVPADSAPDPDPWQLRASDADREAYVELLQAAYLEGRLTKDEYDERMARAYRSMTYAELAPLLADLPVPIELVPGPPQPALPARTVGAVATSGTSGASDSPIMAVFSETKRETRWVLPAEQVSVAIFGSVVLDLRQVLLEQQVSELKASAVFGSVEIIVPGDIDVEVNGVGILGEYKRTESRVTPQPPDSRSPRVTITGAAVFGSVEVKVVDIPVTGSDRMLPPPEAPPTIGP